MRVLAIMCHPDDMEIKCAGTLLRYVADGHKVFSCTVANGNMGHNVIMPQELREIRTEEVKASNAIAGTEPIFADFGDLTINSANEIQQKELIRIIRYASPDVIITHDPNDYCSDHVEVSKLVFNAAFSATCPHFCSELGEVAPMASIYYADTDGGVNFIPTEYVDITDVMEQKISMLNCHKSQMEWLSEHDGIDALAEVKMRASFFGQHCGVKYAEAFRPMLVIGRMKTFRVLP